MCPNYSGITAWCFSKQIAQLWKHKSPSAMTSAPDTVRGREGAASYAVPQTVYIQENAPHRSAQGPLASRIYRQTTTQTFPGERVEVGYAGQLPPESTGST